MCRAGAVQWRTPADCTVRQVRAKLSGVSFVDLAFDGGQAGRVLFGPPQLNTMSCLIDGNVWTDVAIAKHVDPARGDASANEGMRVLVSAALDHLQRRGFAVPVGQDGWQITAAGREAYALRSER